MYRIFITNWTLVGNEIHNPIVDHIDTLPTYGVTCRMYYPDADADGLPDIDRVILIVNGPQIIESFATLPGVSMMMPAHPLSTPVADMPSAVVVATRDALIANRIPQLVLTGAQTYGDVLYRSVKYFAPNFAGFDAEMISADIEFG